MPERPQARPIPILTSRLPNAPGPRDAARAVAEIRAARKSMLVRDATTRESTPRMRDAEGDASCDYCARVGRQYRRFWRS